MMFQMNLDLPAGLRDIHIWKCERMDAHTNGRTDAGSSPIL